MCVVIDPSKVLKLCMFFIFRRSFSMGEDDSTFIFISFPTILKTKALDLRDQNEHRIGRTVHIIHFLAFTLTLFAFSFSLSLAFIDPRCRSLKFLMSGSVLAVTSNIYIFYITIYCRLDNKNTCFRIYLIIFSSILTLVNLMLYYYVAVMDRSLYGYKFVGDERPYLRMLYSISA